MPPSSPEFDQSEMWDRLGHLLDSYSRAWNQAPPAPRLRDFVPPPHDNLRSLALIELVKVDMEFRTRPSQDWRPLTSYVEEWPELKFNAELPPDLVLEESRLRGLVDGTVRAEEIAPSRSNRPERNTLAVSRARHLQRYRPGMTVDDFDLLTHLGRGAFATVFLARQNSMQRLVALKISDDQGLEPQTLAQLDHRHIVRVYDQRVMPGERIRLMYMQFVPGGSLSEILERVHKQTSSPTGQSFIDALDSLLVEKGQVTPEESETRRWIRSATWPEVVARLGSQLAEALNYAHEKGVLHRDLKPANVLVDAQGNPKIVDFNISFSDKIAGATPASYFGGSLAFMSPEQLEATSLKHERTPDSLDGRSDLYALGVILFEMLTFRYPFHDVQPSDWSQTVPNMIEVRRAGIPPDSQALLNDQPFLIRRVVERCLEQEPNDRFPSGKAVADQLHWAIDSDIARYLNPPQRLQAWLAEFTVRFPFAMVCLLGVTVGLAAGAFIFTYNLIQAVPYEELDFFDRVRKTVNRTAFPIGTLLLLWYFWPLRKALTRLQTDPDIQLATANQAIKTALRFSAFFALVAATEWSIAGLLYPSILTLSGVTIGFMGWFDFAISHALTGLSMAAYAFVCLTFLALRFWVPKLLHASLNLQLKIDWTEEVQRISRHLLIAQITAVASPMFAIALLVNLHRTSSSFALGVLSVTALLGLVVLALASREIYRDLEAVGKLSGKADVR